MADWITHEEDVWWDFRGNHPEQLKPGRYYRGTVDGFAEFGVFVNLGDNVTGLLHKSELDTRLESLDWDPGDTVFVQVTDIRDNGNVDLGWSIRQSEREFRGSRVHDPDRPDDEEPARPADGSKKKEPTVRSVDEVQQTSAESDDVDDAEAAAADTEADEVGSEVFEAEAATHEANGQSEADDAQATEADGEEGTELRRTTVDALSDQVGEVVSIEGRIVDARQTSGPTVFELKDETGTVECAAFVEAGVRAYPDVEVDEVVRLVGEVERRHGELQVETEELTILKDDEREAVETRLEDAIREEARAPDEDLLGEDGAPEGVVAVTDQIRDAATEIRRAVMAARPVVVRHSPTADGYAGAAAIERAVLPMVREEHPAHDAEYHFFERRPLADGVYDMDSATKDVTDMLEARERHGESLPLVVLVDAGGTRDSAPGYGLLDVYGVERLVVTDGRPDPEIDEEVDEVVNPYLADDAAEGDDVTSTALAANVAAHVNPEVRDDVSHLPAVSYWDDVPAAYADLAEAATYDDLELAHVREALAFEAYYQSYEDKREIVEDVLFDTDEAFVAHLSEQFHERLDDELESAERNLGIREAQGITFAVLDTDAFTHRFDFPPTDLLLDALHRRQRDEYETLVTIGLDEDDLRFRTTEALDLRTVGEGARSRAEDAGIHVVGGTEGRIEFLAGERDAVLEAVVAAFADELA